MEVDTFTAQHLSSQTADSNSFADEFASKTSLGGSEYMEDDDDSSSYSKYSSFGEDEESSEGYGYSDYRTVLEDGLKVKIPANYWFIVLKDPPPEGCRIETYHLNILKLVVGSDAEVLKEVYDEYQSERSFTAILTNEEHDKVRALEQVARTLKTGGYTLD